MQPLLAKSSPPTHRSNARRDEDVSIATDPRTRTGSEVSGVSKGRLTSDVEELDYEPLELHDVGAGDPVDVAVKSSKRSVLQVYLLLLKLVRYCTGTIWSRGLFGRGQLSRSYLVPETV